MWRAHSTVITPMFAPQSMAMTPSPCFSRRHSAVAMLASYMENLPSLNSYRRPRKCAHRPPDSRDGSGSWSMVGRSQHERLGRTGFCAWPAWPPTALYAAAPSPFSQQSVPTAHDAGLEPRAEAKHDQVLIVVVVELVRRAMDELIAGTEVEV